MENWIESEVKSVQGNGTWDSQHGTLYKFEYEFTDGVVLSAMHKKEEPLPVGARIHYLVTKESEQYGKSGKVKREWTWDNNKSNGAPGPKRDDSFTKGVEVGHAINNGVQIAIAQKGGAVTITDIEVAAKTILALASKMKGEGDSVKEQLDEAIAKAAPAPPPKPVEQQWENENDNAQPPQSAEQTSGDLPF